MLTRLYQFIFLSTLFSLSLYFTNTVSANETLWAKLAEGGKVVLMRHALVNRGPDSGNSLVRDPSCKKERTLSPEGQQQAKLVGQRFKDRNIPIAEVRHSPYCRTTETATLAFGKAQSATYLSLLEVLSTEDAATQTQKLREVIAAHTGKGNLILVSHEPNITAVVFETVKYADFLVLQPGPDGSYEELGVIRFTD